MQFQTLSVQDVQQIYDVLVRDFAEDDDPIAPVGTRSQALLESAVSRQHTGIGGTLKYPDPVSNAASLTYGICCDHPFFNGNKRTALVAMLVHLDRNKRWLPRVSQDELYKVMLAIADHRIGLRPDSRKRQTLPPRRNADEEVAALTGWLNDGRVQVIKRGEKLVTYRQLRRILANFDIHLENAGQNSVEVVKYVEESRGFLIRRKERVRKRITTIGYRDEGTVLAMKDLKQLRKHCSLSEEDGVDSGTFYEAGEVIDAFVNRYRTVLRRLARR